MKTGWEVKPFGWFAIITLTGVVIIYFTFFYSKTKKQKAEPRIKTNVDNG